MALPTTYQASRGGSGTTEYFVQFFDGNTTPVDAAQLLPQLLNQLAVLGDLAKRISQSLGGNGHRPEAAEKLIGELIAGRHS